MLEPIQRVEGEERLTARTLETKEATPEKNENTQDSRALILEIIHGTEPAREEQGNRGQE